MNFRSNLLLFFLVSISLLSSTVTFGQKTEAELKSDADKVYRDENYVESSKLYSQLLAFNSLDPFYNFRYGVSLIYNSRKKQEAIKHLIFASKEENVDPEVFFYLGKAYHLNYEFGEAIKYYNLYKTKAGSKIDITLQVNRQIEMSENGKRLFTAMNEIVVLEKKEIETGNFFRIYDLKNIGGEMLVTAQFQSKIDKKKNHIPLIHFPANPNTIFYSSYGEDEKSGKNIYIRRRLPDGTWSLPQTVNGDVNTQFDEDFPYMHPGGDYLYFSSKGHNSMGGYDIFRSKYDKENNTFSKAENLDFAISSPDNDLFYVVDSLDRNAYFASNRQSLDGKIHVYKVRVAQVPIQLVVVKAAFSSTINPANKKISVDVADYASGTKIGTFNANDKGNVLMTFPKGGKYEYQMKVDGVPTVFKSVVSIPFLTELKPLKQKLIHEKPETGEIVTIVNLFDEAVEDPVATMTEIAKIRAELNPNSDQFDLNVLDKGATTPNREVYAQIGMGKLSDAEVQQKIETLATNREKVTDNFKSLQEKAIDQTVQNVKDIVQLQADLKKVVAQADSKQGSEKRELFEQAAGIVNELNRLETESKKLLKFADSLNAAIKASDLADDQIRKVSDEVKKAYNKNDLVELSKIITDNKALIQEQQKENSALVTEQLVKDVVAKKEEIKKIENKQKEYLDSKVTLKQEILDLEKKLAEAKAKDQPDIQRKLTQKKEELEMVEVELKGFENKLVTKHEDLNQLEKKLAFFQDVQNSKAADSNLSSPDANKALIASDNQNNRTLEAYVEQQSKQLGFDMYAVKPIQRDPLTSDKTDLNLSAQNTGKNPTDQHTNDQKTSSQQDTKATQLTPDQTQLVARLTPDYTKNIEIIQSDPQLSEEQKLKSLQRQDKELKFQLAKDISRVENALLENPKDPALNKELKDLQEIKSTLNNRIDQKQSELSKKYPESNPPVKITESQLTNQIKPHHQAILLSLEGNDDLTQTQKTEKAQTEDQTFIGLLYKEKARLEDEVLKDPTNERSKHELSLVKLIITDTEKRIEKRSMEMASFSIADVKTEDVKTQDVKTEDVKTQDVKTQDVKTQDVNTQDVKTQDVKTQDVKTQDVKTEDVKTQDVKTEDVKTQDVKTQDVKTQDVKTQDVKTEDVKTQDVKTQDVKTEDVKTQDVKTQDVKTQDVKTQDVMTEEQQQLLAKVKPDYQSKTEAIKQNASLSEKDKQTKLIAEEKYLQKNLDLKITALDRKIKANPSDSAQVKEREQLQFLKDESQNRLDESSQLVLSEEKKAINKEDLLLKTDKTYATDVKAIQEKTPEQSTQQLINRETKLQQAIQTKIAANDKKIALNGDLKATAENQVLNELLDDSKARQNQLQGGPLVTDNTPSTEIRKANLGENESLLQADLKTVAELKNQDQVLGEYQTKLESLITDNQQKLTVNPQDNGLVETQKVLENELNLVKEKRRKVKITIGELEQQQVVETNPAIALVDPKIQSLQSEEVAIQNRLNDPATSKKEKKALDKQLVANQEEQSQITDKNLQAKVDQLKQENPNQLNPALANGPDQAILSKDSLQYSRLLKNQEQVKKDLTLLEKTKKTEDKKELLKGIETTQLKNEQLLEELTYDAQLKRDVQELKKDDPQATLLSLEGDNSLQKRKMRVSIQVGELETELEQLNTAYLSPKTPDKQNLKKKIKAKEQELAALKGEQRSIEEELTRRSEEEKAVNASTPIAASVSEEEKTTLSTNPEYADLKSAYEAKNAAQDELKSAYTDLQSAKETYSKAVEASAKNPSTENKKAVQDAAQDLKSKNKYCLELKNKHEDLVSSYKKASSSQEDLAKLERLFEDGVVPGFKPVIVPLITDVVAFKILETPHTEPAKERIPIGKDMPMGLVYRVQVGAFAKPLKQNLFTEFTPVTGEKIKSGITRYITGYFNSIGSASDAKKQIQKFGYDDAFIVAYCDGKRITIAEAQRLEASGQCVPKPESEILNVISNNQGTGDKQGSQGNSQNPDKQISGRDPKLNSGDKKVDSQTNPVDASVGDYNKGPGAVKAIAVETKPGLFYTVQIGAYNTPATPKQLKFIENVVSKKLGDGKIRYSTGIFSSVSEAAPTKSMAVSKGISDAFVTAYYKGERITLAEAEKLLKQYGSGILESNKPTAVVTENVEEIRQPEPEPEPEVVEKVIPKSEQYLQFVTKKNYTEFPQDDLRRFNETGMYYYDAKAQKIKSVVYKKRIGLPQIYYYKGEMDSVYLLPTEYEQSLETTLSVQTKSSVKTLDGACMDWLLRLPYQREIVPGTDGVFVSIREIDTEAHKQEVLQKLNSFGFQIFVGTKP